MEDKKLNKAEPDKAKKAAAQAEELADEALDNVAGGISYMNGDLPENHIQ